MFSKPQKAIIIGSLLSIPALNTHVMVNAYGIAGTIAIWATDLVLATILWKAKN